MSHITLAAFTAAGELLVYFIIGGILPFAAKGEKKSLFETVTAGWIITTAVMEVTAVICMRANLSLYEFSRCAVITLSVLMALSMVINFQSIFRGTAVVSGGMSFFFSVFAVIVVMIGSVALVLILPAAGDPGGIIAQMSADIRSDSMHVMIPGSMAVRTSFSTKDLLVRYHAFDTLVAELTGLHPMIVMRVVRAPVVAVLSGMIIYRIFYRLFDGRHGESGAAAVLAIVAGAAFRTAYTPSGLLYAEGWTGNASLACVLLPAVILIGIVILKQEQNRRTGILLFLSGIAAVSLSPSALMLWPAAAVSVMVPVSIFGKKWKGLIALMLSLAAPSAAMLMYVYR